MMECLRSEQLLLLVLPSGRTFDESLVARKFLECLLEAGFDADFSDIAAKTLRVGGVAYKATVTVNEEGAEAGAATAVLGARSAVASQPPVEMIVKQAVHRGADSSPQRSAGDACAAKSARLGCAFGNRKLIAERA